MSYELIFTPAEMETGLFEIRDDKHYPVLYTAIVEDIDVLITGDKDFTEAAAERQKILTPSEFPDSHCKAWKT